MTKTFEEEAKEKFLNSSRLYIAHEGTHADVDKGGGMALKLRGVVYVFPWLEFARNWHSDGEFQELFDKFSNLNDNYEKEVVRSSKLESQIIELKSQLQQQSLPVVPECVAKWIEELKGKGYGPLKNPCTYGEAISELSDKSLEKILNWISINQEKFMRAWLDGYTVEKPQMFYLKHIDMSKRDKEHDYFAQIRNDRFEHDSVESGTLPGIEVVGVRFTKQEIDSMETGSYEKIEVAQ